MTTTSGPIPDITLDSGAAIPQPGYGILALQPDREANDTNAKITEPIVGQALAAGYRHIDTAQAYGTELGVGRAIAASGLPREELFITSKLANAHHAPKNLERSSEQTLQDLGVDQLDLFLIHWPLPNPLRGDYVSGIVSAGNQFEIHPYFNNDAPREACKRHGIAVEAHGPLGHNSAPLSAPAIAAIAAAHDRTVAQVILRWHMQHPIITIPKSAKPQRMAENLDVFDFELTARTSPPSTLSTRARTVALDRTPTPTRESDHESNPRLRRSGREGRTGRQRTRGAGRVRTSRAARGFGSAGSDVPGRCVPLAWTLYAVNRSPSRATKCTRPSSLGEQAR
jgi:2,5-diketo-D-gluconate reductase A